MRAGSAQLAHMKHSRPPPSPFFLGLKIDENQNYEMHPTHPPNLSAPRRATA